MLTALFFFVVAAVLALATNAPLRYRKTKEENLRPLIDSSWSDAEAAGAETISRNRVTILTTSARLNSWKAGFLLAAMAFEVLAVTAIAIAVWIIL